MLEAERQKGVWFIHYFYSFLKIAHKVKFKTIQFYINVVDVVC